MVDINFLTEFVSLVIVGICLILGFIIKNAVPEKYYRYIPALCAAMGVVLSIWIYWGNYTPETFLIGLFSGFASTGLHQLFKQFTKTE